MESKSRRPHQLRQPTTPREVQNLVIAWRKSDFELSKYEISEHLKRDGIIISPSTVQRILNRHPELKNAQYLKLRKRRRWSIARRKVARGLRYSHPGGLVQIDTKHLYINFQRFFVFAAIDAKSRLGFVKAFTSGSSLCGATFLGEVVSFFPFPIEAVQTDNGSEYLLNFHKACEEKGIVHYFSDPQCPQQNALVERFIQTMTYEHFNWQDELLNELPLVQESCELFNEKYNQRRLHRSLNYLTPMEYCMNILERKSV